MAADTFRYRTILEVAVISVVIYVLLGTPGLSSKSSKSQDQQAPLPSTPKAGAKIENLVYPSKNLQCERHDYTTHIFSTSPLVIYIDGFLSDEEADHLIALSANKWNPSTISNFNTESLSPTIRNSEKAALPRDQVVQCIESRALAFQGWPRETFIERLWTQRYNVSGHYALHYDWATATKSSRRVSSFMVYLKDECVGGGTRFPRLERPAKGESGEIWCWVLECEDTEGEEGEGVTFKPKKGSAVFWMNFDAEGRGYKETIHAGMPVREGQKIGLNIWTWYQAGHEIPTKEVEEM